MWVSAEGNRSNEHAERVVECLICRAAGVLFALPLRDLDETMRPMPVTPTSGGPDFLLGLAVIRGAAAPVVDTALLLGAPRVRAERFVTLRVAERRVALAVEAVVGIRRLRTESFGDLPPLLGQALQDRISALSVLDRQLLYVLDGGRILPDAVRASLDSERNP